MDVDLQSCIDGDKRAWDRFVEECSDLIYAAILRCLGRSALRDRSDVDEIFQNVFIRLLARDCRLLRSYDPQRAALSTWLTLVARSTAIDHIRKKARTTRSLEDTAPPEDAAASETESSVGPEIPLHLLSDRQRIVLRMLFDEEKTVSEVAAMLDISEQTVRSTKHKALSRLRDHFLSPESSPESGLENPGG